MNVNKSNFFSNPNAPALISVTRNLPYGYASLLASSTYSINVSEMINVIQNQIQMIPKNLLELQLNAVYHHEYEPNFQSEKLKNSEGSNAYTLLKNLQGYRKTFYIGSLLSCPGSYVNEEFVHDLFTIVFDSKN